MGRELFYRICAAPLARRGQAFFCPSPRGKVEFQNSARSASTIKQTTLANKQSCASVPDWGVNLTHSDIPQLEYSVECRQSPVVIDQRSTAPEKIIASGRNAECQRKGEPMRGSNRRRYFTEAELARLIKAARDGRYGQRDATLILLMARHGRGHHGKRNCANRQRDESATPSAMRYRNPCQATGQEECDKDAGSARPKGS
jgi:hypothetical protein